MTQRLGRMPRLSLLFDIVVRYSLRGRRAGFSRLVARASMLGMVLGVTSLITVMSIMNGFAGELYGRLLALVPHLEVHDTRGQITDWRALAADIQASDTAIIGVAPAISDTVLLEAWGRQRPARVTGIDLSAQRSVSDLHQQIVSGDVAELESQRFSVAIGSTLSRLLGVGVGDKLQVTLPTLSVTPLGVFPRSATLTVVALFEVGADLDAQQVWVSLDTATRLFARTGVDYLQVELSDPERLDRSSETLKTQLMPIYRVTDWREGRGSLVAAVAMEKVTVAILLLAVIAVAAFNIVSTLTMSVTDKQRDIALLRVLGLPASAIMLVFLGHGLLLGGLGIGLGALLGITLATQISSLAAFIEQLLGVSLFDPRVYYIGRLPSELVWQDVAFTVVAALILSVLATLYPAWRAAQIQPVEALNDG